MRFVNSRPAHHCPLRSRRSRSGATHTPTWNGAGAATEADIHRRRDGMPAMVLVPRPSGYQDDSGSQTRERSSPRSQAQK